MALVGILFVEAFVEVDGQKGGSPVEVGVDGGHEGGEKGGDEQALEPDAEVFVDHHGVGLAVLGKGGEDHDGNQSDHDPEPGPAGLEDGVKESRPDGVAFVAAGRHALHVVTVGVAPPDQSEDHQHLQDVGVEGGEVGKDGQGAFPVLGVGPDAGEDGLEPTGLADRNAGEGEHASHGDEDWTRVGGDHAVKAGEGGVEESHRHQDEDGLHLIEGGEHFDHGAHPEGHPANGQEVLQNSSVTGPHPAEQGGGFALVTELEELGVGDQVGPAPEPGKEKDADDQGEDRYDDPPHPFEPVLAGHLGHPDGGVGGETGGDHGEGRWPTRGGSVRPKRRTRNPWRPCGRSTGRPQSQRSVGGDDGVVEGVHPSFLGAVIDHDVLTKQTVVFAEQGLVGRCLHQ